MDGRVDEPSVGVGVRRRPNMSVVPVECTGRAVRPTRRGVGAWETRRLPWCLVAANLGVALVDFPFVGLFGLVFLFGNTELFSFSVCQRRRSASGSSNRRLPSRLLRKKGKFDL